MIYKRLIWLFSSLIILVGLAIIGVYFFNQPQLRTLPVDVSTPRVQEQVSKMTLEEKVGQLFLARVPIDNQIEDIKTYHPGGYLLFARDMEGQSLESLKAKLSSYQAASQVPLLIASDEEGGQVSRLSTLLEQPFSSAFDLYQAGGLEAIKEDTANKADQLNQLGIKAGLFPVADYASSADSFIYSRTIGKDIQATSDYVAESVRVLKEKHSASTLKHFPGYGDNGDSHLDLIYDNRSLDQLKAQDFKPFEAGIKAGADSILVSHNIMTQIDGLPASLSPTIYQTLRQDLSFQGVAMTDDFDMDGLENFTTQEDAAYQAIAAGADMILSSHYASQIPYLVEQVRQGNLSEDRIDEAVTRILTMKANLGILKS